MEQYEILFNETFAASHLLTEYQGLHNIEALDPNLPVILVFSHQAHDQSDIGSEPRHIANLAINFPRSPRKFRILVRDMGTRKGRLKQAISPIHVRLTTQEVQPDKDMRNRANARVFRGLASFAHKNNGRIVIALAPDAGKTPASFSDLVDPDQVSAGGVTLLLEEFQSRGFTGVPIIPIAFDHNTGVISIGPDCSQVFREASRENKPLVLADAINSAGSLSSHP